MLALTCFTCLIALTSSNRLLATIVLHRHGDRNPFTTYKTDPYTDESHWPEGKGQLNKAGLLRQYELGAWLRDRYTHFLPATYSPKNLKVISTDVDRTLMSAQLTLARLYPEDRFKDDLAWRPIPIHTIPGHLDAFLAFKKPCKKYRELLNELMTSQVVSEFDDVNREMYELVGNKTGEEIRGVYDLEVIYNTLLSQLLANKTLPDWTIGVFPEKMKDAALMRYKIPCFTDGLARLRVGLLFGGFLNFFNGSVGGGDGGIPKMLLLSGHDSTLLDVLTALGAFNNEIPSYSSAILFELYEKEEGAVVNVFLKNATGLFDIVLNKCEFNCMFDKLTEVLQPIVITNQEQWEKECEN